LFENIEKEFKKEVCEKIPTVFLNLKMFSKNY